MGFFDLVAKIEGITSGELTVRERVRIANNPLNLRYPIFFPVRPVRSVKLTEVYTNDHRPTADRRVWNAPGRLITHVSPKIRETSIRPVEAYANFGEEEIQKLLESTQGNQAIMKTLVGADVSSTAMMLSDAVERRIELDAFSAWLSGSVTTKNPQTGVTETHSLGFSGSRYVSDDWSGANNAWDGFIAAAQAAEDLLGALSAVGMRRATWNKIKADAPNPYNSGSVVTNAQLRQMIDEEMPGLRVLIDERTVEVYTDGGVTTTTTNIWTAQKVAFIPQGGLIGETLDAPVARAFEVLQGAPEPQNLLQGVAIFSHAQNEGKTLRVEGQRNALAVPNENAVLVYSVSV